VKNICHCEEHSDEAISWHYGLTMGLLRCACLPAGRFAMTEVEYNLKLKTAQAEQFLVYKIGDEIKLNFF